MKTKEAVEKLQQDVQHWKQVAEGMHPLRLAYIFKKEALTPILLLLFAVPTVLLSVCCQQQQQARPVVHKHLQMVQVLILAPDVFQPRSGTSSILGSAR